MKYLLLCCCCFICVNLHAQVKPIYFKGDQLTSDQSIATSYAIYGKLSSEELWVIKRYDLMDNLMLTGTYQDSLLAVPHGDFVFYMDVAAFNEQNGTAFTIKNKTRFNFQKGSFVNGLEQGRWILFFPDGNILNIQHYVDGKLHGEFKTFDRFGNELISGHYKNGELDGEWLLNKGTKKNTYENGVFKSSVAVKKPKK